MPALISVILPAYNAANYIQIAIQSMLDQTYTHWELIVIDDGSSDNTMAVCRRMQALDERIQVFSKPNEGPSSARNLGLQQVHGQYLMFLDADDRYVPNALEIAVQSIGNKELCVFGWETDPKGCLRHKEIDGDELSIDKEKLYASLILDSLSYGGGFPWNKIWRVPEQGVQIFPRFDEELRLYEDKLWVLENMDRINSYCFIKDKLYRYHIGDSISHNYTLSMFRNAAFAASHIDAYIRFRHPSMLVQSAKLNWHFSLNYAFALLRSNHTMSQIREEPLASRALVSFQFIDVKTLVKSLILRFADKIG